MKRYIALFTATLILVANCIVYTPVKAIGTSVDFGEMLLEYTNLAEIGLALTQGANIDWSGMEYPAGSENWTDQEKAQYVVNYFGSLRNAGLHAIYEYMFEGPNDNPYLQNTAAIAFTNNSSVGAVGVQDLRTQLANALATNSNTHIFQKYTNDVIARFNEYDAMYINRYLDNINEDVEIPVINPDENYISWVNLIENIPWSNFSSTCLVPGNANRTYTANYYPFTSYSYVQLGSGFSNGASLAVCNLLTINVVSYNNIYAYNIDITKLTGAVTRYDSSNGYTVVYPSISFGQSDFAGSNYTNNITHFETNGTLDQVLAHIAQNFRNVNLYVDGVAWSLPGYVIDNPNISVSIPDSVIDTSNDDGKIVAHPIYYPDAMTSDGSIDIDLDKVRDMIVDAIENGRTSISVDDLVDAGAAVKADGTTLTDADTATVDVSVPIEAAKTGELTVPIGSIPPLPGLPPIIPPGGLGDSNTENGFAGMSVLARIINVTVQSVPEPLIMTFFGVIFGMIVLGIIKILHH